MNTHINLKDKNILIGVTGSIAIYKSLELIRLLIKDGANIKVIMTNSAKEFITPLTFEVISQNKILDDINQDWTNEDTKNSGDNHISIGKWADIFVIAPASINTINKIANGICDNILLQSFIAFAQDKPTLLAPAGNTNMLHNPITQSSIDKLKELKVGFVNTQNKELACKDIGDGAMAEPIQIYHQIYRELYKNEFWSSNNQKPKNAIVTGGGTIEKIDDVRYLSNFSSGKMANELALSLYYKGANVTLITTAQITTQLPKEIQIVKVESSEQMLKAIEYSISKKYDNENSNNSEDIQKSYLFQASAVSDYVPQYKIGKLKKDHLGQRWDLNLRENIDILKTISTNNYYKNRLVTIGFKLEHLNKDAKQNAKNMLKFKNLDLVCLNLTSSNPFGSDDNDITLIDYKKETHLGRASKKELSFKILDYIEDINLV
jgi:phosphopantothenoylcysteine decarboxylase/phosphopantothenate--cysteine ligase